MPTSISEIVSFLETLAPPPLQESYDNAGLITGHPDQSCTGILCSLDVTEAVILEAVGKGCNLVVAHHPIVFRGLKRINGSNYVERTIIAAIKNDVAIYAIHTNLDNVLHGVSGRMANMLDLQKTTVLAPKEGLLRKLYTFAPLDHAAAVRQAMFSAGAGHIGQYSECSFNSDGTGTFTAGKDADPYVGKPGELHQEKETRIEVVFPFYLENQVVAAMKTAHPYEEVAYDIVTLTNRYGATGSGMVGELAEPLEEKAFLERLKTVFRVPVIRHTALTGRPVKRVALCGGAGSFLISKALRVNADVYITADLKYHEFFDAEGRMLLADIGHYESEQFTVNLLQEVLEEKFLTFAVLKTTVNTNPVQYF